MHRAQRHDRRKTHAPQFGRIGNGDHFARDFCHHASDFGRIVEECRPKLMLMARMGTAERRLWLKRAALLAAVVAFGLEVADRIGADR